MDQVDVQLMIEEATCILDERIDTLQATVTALQNEVSGISKELDRVRETANHADNYVDPMTVLLT